MTFYEKVMSHDKIYSLMYSPTRVEWETIEEQIIEIDTSILRWFLNKTGFYYVWGWPGPDSNRYTEETYGKGWAFTKEEIIEAWSNEINNE